jgi:hypothetical protein
LKQFENNSMFDSLDVEINAQLGRARTAIALGRRLDRESAIGGRSTLLLPNNFSILLSLKPRISMIQQFAWPE